MVHRLFPAVLPIIPSPQSPRRSTVSPEEVSTRPFLSQTSVPGPGWEGVTRPGPPRLELRGGDAAPSGSGLWAHTPAAVLPLPAQARTSSPQLRSRAPSRVHFSLSPRAAARSLADSSRGDQAKGWNSRGRGQLPNPPPAPSPAPDALGRGARRPLPSRSPPIGWLVPEVIADT